MFARPGKVKIAEDVVNDLTFVCIFCIFLRYKNANKKGVLQMGKKVEFSIEHDDIRHFQADVVALTFAGDFYGAQCRGQVFH